MNICVAGKNKIAIDTVKALIKLNVSRSNIYAIYNRNESGVNSWQPSFKFFCEKEGIKELSLEEAYQIEGLIFLSTEFDRIIKTERFKTTEIFNIHFSALPAYKGMYTSVLPLLYGEEITGVTLHKIDNGIDTGDIIDQTIFKLDTTTTARELYDLFLHHSSELISTNLANLLNQTYSTQPQPSRNSTYYSKKTIDFKKINIDTNKTAWEINNQIKAFSFRPYQLPTIHNKKVTHALLLNEKSADKPGTIMQENQDTIKLATIDYDILIFKDRLDSILNYAEVGDNISLKRMKNLGFNIFEKNTKGWDTLIVAAYHAQYETCQWLIKNGANVNTINNNGTNAVMYAMTSASRYNDLSTLKLLIKAGADVYHRDYSGKSLFEYALEQGSPSVIHYIKEHIT